MNKIAVPILDIILCTRSNSYGYELQLNKPVNYTYTIQQIQQIPQDYEYVVLKLKTLKASDHLFDIELEFYTNESDAVTARQEIFNNFHINHNEMLANLLFTYGTQIISYLEDNTNQQSLFCDLNSSNVIKLSYLKQFTIIIDELLKANAEILMDSRELLDGLKHEGYSMPKDDLVDNTSQEHQREDERLPPLEYNEPEELRTAFFIKQQQASMNKWSEHPPSYGIDTVTNSVTNTVQTDSVRNTVQTDRNWKEILLSVLIIAFGVVVCIGMVVGATIIIILI